MKARLKISEVIAWIALVSAVILLGASCGKGSKSKRDAEGLVQIYCGSCHLVPQPSELTRDRWEDFVLPRMGYFLGIYSDTVTRASLIEAGDGGELVESAKVFPEKQVLDEADWMAINDYYLSNSPDYIDIEAKSIEVDSTFYPLYPDLYMSPPGITMTQFTNDGGLLVADAQTKGLLALDTAFNVVNAANVSEGAVQAEKIGQELYVTVMGQFSPTDAPGGFIMTLPADGQGSPRIVIDELQRPVHAAFADLHGDDKMDVVVCEFGKWTGGLSLFHNLGEGKYEKHILLNTPGATRVYVRDMNGDGRRDIIALFAQGSEGIDIYYNKGNSEFSRTRVLRFPATYGSSYFDLFDFNDDGALDIIYTAGDNADFKPLMKPYHGVYIFMNDGRNNFKQAFFQQINGAYKAIPADFDGDGHHDIAAISFFPDWEKSPEEAFVLMHNTGKGEFDFELSTFDGFDMGRWITMDAADYDSDGDLDLVLGSLALEVIPDNGEVDKWVRNGVPFVVLRNLSR